MAVKQVLKFGRNAANLMPIVSFGNDTKPLKYFVDKCREEHGVIRTKDIAATIANEYGIAATDDEINEISGKVRSKMAEVLAWKRKAGDKMGIDPPTVVHGALMAARLGGSIRGVAGDAKMIVAIEDGSPLANAKPFDAKLGKIQKGDFIVSFEENFESEGEVLPLVVGIRRGKDFATHVEIPVDSAREELYQEKIANWTCEKNERGMVWNPDMSVSGATADDV